MAKDTNIYRVTYTNGETKMVRRGTLSQIVSSHLRRAHWHKHPVKVECAPQPEWEDVTEEFLGGPDGPA